ncbi:Lipase member I, partial [Fragariocoptes setiger]
WCYDLKDAYFEREPAQNVIIVFWPGGSRILSYTTAASNTRVVARQIVVFLHYLNELFGPIHLDQVHFIGHSLGAHIAGFAGQDLDGRVARITALDPAGLHFAHLEPEWRLDRSDARFVDVLHTNAGDIYKSKFGMARAVGHIDYYPNGGSQQPGCYSAGIYTIGLDASVCAHERAVLLVRDVVSSASTNCANANTSSPMPTSSHKSATKCVTKAKPKAYLFDVHEDEVRGGYEPVVGFLHDSLRQSRPALPAEHELEFDSMKPQFPTDTPYNATYLFLTRDEAPFFADHHMVRLEQLSQSGITRKPIKPSGIYVNANKELVFEKSIKFEHPVMDLLFLDTHHTKFSQRYSIRNDSDNSYNELDLMVCFHQTTIFQMLQTIELKSISLVVLNDHQGWQLVKLTQNDTDDPSKIIIPETRCGQFSLSTVLATGNS